MVIITTVIVDYIISVYMQNICQWNSLWLAEAVSHYPITTFGTQWAQGFIDLHLFKSTNPDHIYPITWQ